MDIVCFYNGTACWFPNYKAKTWVRDLCIWFLFNTVLFSILTISAAKVIQFHLFFFFFFPFFCYDRYTISDVIKTNFYHCRQIKIIAPNFYHEHCTFLYYLVFCFPYGALYVNIWLNIIFLTFNYFRLRRKLHCNCKTQEWATYSIIYMIRIASDI
jgi:hypothetical protein